jgi:hypothetical protein
MKDYQENPMIKEPDKLPYSGVELSNVKAKVGEVDSLFKVIHQTTHLPLNKLGFLSYEGDSVYYKNCLGPDGEHYIKSKECNFAQVLGEVGNKQLSASIDSLRSKGIKGGFYGTTNGSFYCILDVPYRDYEDGRYLFVNTTGVNMYDHLFMYAVVERSQDVYLLKPKH